MHELILFIIIFIYQQIYWKTVLITIDCAQIQYY